MWNNPTQRKEKGMNEVETYLRESGKWATPIDTDWRGRAVQGTWWPTYYAQWLDAHDDEREQRGLEPAFWAGNDRGQKWWITTTPEWDKQWFHAQGVRPPKRFGDKERTYWKDCGGGLSGRGYRA